jgi:tol-pal system protein YbgF
MACVLSPTTILVKGGILMIKMSYTALIILLMTVFLGCSSGRIAVLEESQLSQQKRMNEALGQIERISAESLKAQSDFEQINKRLLDLEARVNAISTENVATLQEIKDDISFLNEQLSRLDKSSVNPGAVRQNHTAIKANGVFKPGGFDLNKAYESAYSDYNAKKYEAAISGFKEILTVAPTSKLADNSQYWIGESYDALGQYDNAIDAFNKVFDFRTSNKTADAHLKIGLIYLKTGRNDLAVEEFKTVITNYPGSGASVIASSKIGALEQK